MNMTKYQSILITGMILTLLSGCSIDPEQESVALAMSKSQIESLDVNTKQKYIAAYRHNQKVMRSAQLYSQTSQHNTVTVTLSDALARTHPNYQHERIKPTRFTLKGNQCDIIHISAKDSKNESYLSACYLNNQLYLDASSIDENYPVGSFIIPISNIVDSTQSFCEVKTKGNAQLRQACLSISTNETDSTRPVQKLTQAKKNKQFTAKPRLDESSDDSIIHYDAT